MLKTCLLPSSTACALAISILALLRPSTTVADILYVSNEGAATNAITTFTSGGAGSVFPTSGVTGRGGTAFDSVANLYVANGNGTIAEITPGGSVSTFASLAPGETGWGLAFDSGGNLFVAAQSNAPNNTIEKITPAGAVSVF